ncbi:MAG: glycerol-3-phosphate dehydrogenase/oxidase [Candidatus Marinimicrobia bacterium]|nr:glycerol-3-phosphate dehydrogenase/oxidase [Candidatus Neomarinimicrobiota bacterium]
MLNDKWRQKTWSDIKKSWDIIVIGGGITGAGILREATRAGLSALLVEAGDFACGTSSRSSKMVHGGLRYLKNAQLKITYESVSERKRLLAEGKGLIREMAFLYGCFKGDKLPGWVFGIGLCVYDILARTWRHRRYDSFDMQGFCPFLTNPKLLAGYRFFDATTDDARLVFRVIREAVADGGTAMNYACVDKLILTNDGNVCGVVLSDQSPEKRGDVEIQAKVVINATGPNVDKMRAQIGKKRKLRPLRGSHFIISRKRLPLIRAVTFSHPDDGRPVYALPWENAIIFGTTDVDHGENPTLNPRISVRETEYLLKAMDYVFPEIDLGYGDVQSTYSGIRPTYDTGKEDPSKESREHVVWQENGLLSVSGGKLTTFRLMARDALRIVRKRLPKLKGFSKDHRILDSVPDDFAKPIENLSPRTQLRLSGRYGMEAFNLMDSAGNGEFEKIEETPYLWAELRWSARAEAIVHLEDLLLRRVRLGNLLPNGGIHLLDRIKAIVQPELDWSDARWTDEVNSYKKLWKNCYSLQ